MVVDETGDVKKGVHSVGTLIGPLSWKSLTRDRALFERRNTNRAEAKEKFGLGAPDPAIVRSAVPHANCCIRAGQIPAGHADRKAKYL
nr:hypothetical protein [Mycobacterium simiae]